jgi:predicted 3-demethylubiquinone-9 3-methyltransferase (glyoxalase superfamily)
MGSTVAPFLMFEGSARQALDLYVAAFADAEVVEIDAFDHDGPGAPGTVRAARLRLGDREIRLHDSYVRHDFNFTPATSLFVELDSVEEIDAAFATLTDGGEILMPLGPYPFSPHFGWCNDRFGVSWQLSLASA